MTWLTPYSKPCGYYGPHRPQWDWLWQNLKFCCPFDEGQGGLPTELIQHRTAVRNDPTFALRARTGEGSILGQAARCDDTGPGNEKSFVWSGAVGNGLRIDLNNRFTMVVYFQGIQGGDGAQDTIMSFQHPMTPELSFLFQVRSNTNELFFDVDGANISGPSQGPLIGNTHILAATFNPPFYSIYDNGQRVATGLTARSAIGRIGALKVGGAVNANKIAATGHGLYTLAMLLDTNMTLDMYQALYQDPFGFLKVFEEFKIPKRKPEADFTVDADIGFNFDIDDGTEVDSIEAQIASGFDLDSEEGTKVDSIESDSGTEFDMEIL